MKSQNQNQNYKNIWDVIVYLIQNSKLSNNEIIDLVKQFQSISILSKTNYSKFFEALNMKIEITVADVASHDGLVNYLQSKGIFVGEKFISAKSDNLIEAKKEGSLYTSERAFL